MTTPLIDIDPPSDAARLRDEVAGADFGDERLNRRLVKIIEGLGAKPHLSIPAATDGRAEMEAAYRFFDNEKVAPTEIMAPHAVATLERVRQCSTVVLVQDTTELDLTRPSSQVRGAGPIDSETRRGAMYHPLIAYTLEGIALGTVWRKAWARTTIDTPLTPSEKARKRQTTPIEEKESFRWLEGQRAALLVATKCPDTQCICVSDSESDIYEMFTEPRVKAQPPMGATATPGSMPARPLELVIRAAQERNTESGDWLNDVRGTRELFSCQVKVSKRIAKVKANKSPRAQPRDARVAAVSVRAKSVTLQPPDRHDRQLPPVTLNLVLVEEHQPPDGCEPVRWLLVTTLPIATVEDVQRVVAIYCIRWQIEITQAEYISRKSLYLGFGRRKWGNSHRDRCSSGAGSMVTDSAFRL